MRTFRNFALLAAALLHLSSWSGPAFAALSWEFGFEGTENNFSGTGSFTLGGDSGPPSDLAAFEFTGVCGLDDMGNDNNCSFDLGGITVSDWLLQPDWTFSSLIIGAIDTTEDALISYFLGLSSDAMLLNCASLNLAEVCNGFSGANRFGFVGEGAFLRPIHEGKVPEPPTLGIFLLGLSALAAAVAFPSRRRKKSGGRLSGV